MHSGGGLAMALQLKSVVEGWTEPIRHRLLNDGAAIDIQGRTVELILERKDGVAVDTSGKTANLDDGTEALKGVVQYSPADGDLTVAGSQYYVQWKVTAFGTDAFWPNEEPARLRVYPQGKA